MKSTPQRACGRGEVCVSVADSGFEPAKFDGRKVDFRKGNMEIVMGYLAKNRRSDLQMTWKTEVLTAPKVLLRPGFPASKREFASPRMNGRLYLARREDSLTCWVMEATLEL